MTRTAHPTTVERGHAESPGAERPPRAGVFHADEELPPCPPGVSSSQRDAGLQVPLGKCLLIFAEFT